MGNNSPAVGVMHVIGSLDRGGAETATLDLCPHVRPTGAALRYAGSGGTVAQRAAPWG
jgi:hypothetical protein